MTTQTQPSEPERCTSCKGRGWHVGECHPQETCGVCAGTGYAHPEQAVADMQATIARQRARIAELEAERNTVRECMLTNEAELRRADGRIGELEADVAGLRGQLQDVAKAIKSEIAPERDDYGRGYNHGLAIACGIARSHALATPPPTNDTETG